MARAPNRRKQPVFRNAREEALWTTVKSMPSDQISRVFDRYLEMLLTPVALYTDLVHEGIAEVLALLTKHRRKVTNEDRDRAITRLFVAMSSDRAQTAKTLLDLNIERNILLDMVYDALHHDTGFLPGIDPEPLRRHLRVLLEDLELFRSLVLHRYTPLINKQSGNFVWGRRQNGLLVEDADARQNHFMAAMRAVDKFDSKSGTLTTFMGNWLRSASHSFFSLHVGEAYSITRGVRSKIHRGEVEYNNHAVRLHDNPRVENTAPEEDDPEEIALAELTLDAVRLLRLNEQVPLYRFALLALRANYPLTAAEMAAQTATLPEESYAS